MVLDAEVEEVGTAGDTRVVRSTHHLEATGRLLVGQVEDGWREGPAIDKGARWEPAEVGDAVERLLAERVAPRKVWGS